MALPLILGSLVSSLLSQGLNGLANAAIVKGKDWVEEKTGLDLNDVSMGKPVDPALAQQLQMAEMTHAVELAEIKQKDNALEAHLIEVHLKDKDSARLRDIEVLKVMGKNQRGDILAYGAVGALALCIILLFTVRIPTDARDLLLILLGSLVVIVKDVYSFEFGSSKDSARNAQTVSDIARGGTPTP